MTQTMVKDYEMDHTGRIVLFVIAASPVGADNSKCWNPNTPPPLYPNPNYWYYPPQSPEEQQQFWEHYNAMCAYMAQMNAAAYRYSPYPMYPYPYLYPSDNEEYSGYSSSDEMTYYGQMFKKQAEMAQAAKQAQAAAESAQAHLNANPEINRESSQSSVNSEETEKGDDTEDTSGTDTEVEDDEAKMNSLQSIKSVPNINVYNDSDTQTEESEESEEESEGKSEVEGDIPHQLSIIYEESEHSDIEGHKKFPLCREQSQSNDSCATLQSDEGDDNDNSTDSTVTVRLPLQFKFSRSSNDEEVATVIVGNSEVESGRATPVSAPENLIITEIVREDSDPDVTATICLKKFKKKPEQTDNSEKIKNSVTPTLGDSNSTSGSPVDFWKDIPDKETYASKQNLRASNETPSQTSEDDSKHEESDYHSSSTSIQTVKKGLSGSENLSGSETDTAYCINLKKYTDNNSPCNDTELDDDEDNDNPKQQQERTEQSSKEEEEEEEQELVEEYDDDEDEGDRKEQTLKTNGTATKDDRSRESETTNSSSSSEEEEDDDEEEEDEEGSDQSGYEPEVVKAQQPSVKEDEVSVTIKVPSIRKEQEEASASTKIMDVDEEEDSEDGESEVSERVSSRTSSSEDEEEEDEDIVEQKQCKPAAKKEIQRPQSKLEKHRSQEESEEDDSGVTSDLSRHISETDTDPECGGELRKMTRYQRAATHSRLFKLLQEECKVDESPEDEPEALSARKERLSLPLQNQFSVEQESLSSSSGINSPSSPTTTDKLVKELVKSLLSRKKGRHFRKLPLEKLHAAALRILQEDMDPYDTASTSDDSNNLLSPVASTSSSAPADTPNQAGLGNPEVYGGNYYDYCRYYSTWGNPELYGAGYDVPDEYEILPSKAFRILQENTQPEGYSSPVPRIAVPVRCPRVSHPPIQPPLPPTESNANSSIPESTSTSQET